ncbi:MAG: hypothetical protein RSD54_08805 [Ruthenibacterium sp.]
MDIKEKERLRTLAKKQLAWANSPVNLARVDEWKRHNAGKRGRPIVHVEIDTFEDEIISPALQCKDATARCLEADLLRNFTNIELFDDDWVVAPYFGVQWKTNFNLFGYHITRTTAVDANGHSLGHQFNHVLADLEEEYDKLHQSTWSVDREATERYRSAAEDAFGDILPVRMTMASPDAVPTQKIVHLMGMENMFFSMTDYPELFLQMMQRVAQDYRGYHQFLQDNGLLCSTTGFELLKQGSKCFTDCLPQKEHPALNEVWGFMDSQETVSISPQMYRELVFPCYRQIAAQFGQLSYGCCEPVSAVWEFVKTLPNLRKVSVSPWCDQRFMGSELQNTDIIFHRKPSPNFLGVDRVLDEATVRAHIKETLDAAAGCVIEFTQRDVYTVHNNPAKVRRYVELIREQCEQYYKP